MSFSVREVIGTVAGIIVGAILGSNLWKQPTPMFQSPSADNKAEQSYRRSGFGDRILTQERRIKLSECYKKTLSDNGYDPNNPTPKPTSNSQQKVENYEGKVIFLFHVAEDGKMLSNELIDSDFKDDKLTNCISDSLQGLRFLPPPLGINRYLAHEFIFKSDETFKKEMEERKNQSPLMLVTPTQGASNP